MPASRDAQPTIRFVDEYCQIFEGLFPEVRSFEAFKLLHLGMSSEIKRKSLPAIAKAVGLDNQQNLHHFQSRISLDSTTTTTETIRVGSKSPQWRIIDSVD